MAKVHMMAMVAAVLAVPMAASAAGEPVLINGEMTSTVIPQAQAIWDVTNAATDDAGEPVAAKFTPAAWARIEQAALAIQQAFDKLHAAGSIGVAAPGVKISGDDSPVGAGAAKVQGFVDANPDDFRARAKSFAGFAGGMAKAAQRRDLKALMGSVEEMDTTCESCHKVYWYPDVPPRA